MKFAHLMVASVVIATAGAGLASTPALTLTSPGLPYSTYQYTLGFSFTAGSAVTVTKLGIYDWNADGLENNAQVGLWASDGTLLASTAIGAGTAGQLIDTFRYGAITPYALTAGTQYFVGAYMDSAVVGTATSFGTGQGGSGSFDAVLTNVFDQYSPFDSAFGFPGSTNGNAGGVWLGANFVYGADVPEPASWALMIAGFGLVGGAMRSRRVVAA